MGKFRLTDADGQNFAPSGSKARALLALLSVAPNHSRTRTWLKDRLWSDRGPEQAASSLRNVLSEIRRALGDHRALLVTDGDSVLLDPNGIQFNFVPPVKGAALEDVEPFEDIDAKDPEFEHQIRDLRAHLKERQKTTAPPRKVPSGKKVVVFVNDRNGSSETTQIAAHLIQNAIEYQLRQFSDIEIYDLSNPLIDAASIPFHPEHQLLVRISTIAGHECVFQTVSLETPTPTRRLWADQYVLSSNCDLLREVTPIQNTCFRIVQRIFDAFSESRLLRGATSLILGVMISPKRISFSVGRSN